jgi:hypothetical protein
MWGFRNTHKIFILETSRDLKMGLKEIRCEGVDWIQMNQVRVQRERIFGFDKY